MKFLKRSRFWKKPTTPSSSSSSSSVNEISMDCGGEAGQ